MTYVCNYGRPDLFITFTCNPNWAEIKEELFIGQQPTGRLDISARVLKQKLSKYTDAIIKSHIYEEIRCECIPYSGKKKRPSIYPHTHILIWLKDKLRSTQIDRVTWSSITEG